MADEKLLIKFPAETDKNAWLDYVKDARKFYSDATPLGFKDEEHFREWLNNLINLNVGTHIKDGVAPQSTFFMFNGNRIIGYLTIKRKVINQKNVGQIYFNIRPSDRKKGYGTKLMNAALNKCKEINLSEAVISCPDESLGAIKIIESHGGKLVETKFLNGTEIKMRIYLIKL